MKSIWDLGDVVSCGAKVKYKSKGPKRVIAMPRQARLDVPGTLHHIIVRENYR